MSEWEDIYLKLLALDPNFKLVTPIDPLPGEAVEDTSLRYWIDQGILIVVSPDEFDIDMQRAEEVDPNIAKFLAASQQAELAEIMDLLECDGYVYSSVDSDGNLVYCLTEEGKIYFESIQAEDN